MNPRTAINLSLIHIFNQEEFLEKVKKALETTPNLVVCVSEGINDGNGTFICEFASDVGVDKMCIRDSLRSENVSDFRCQPTADAQLF